MNKRGDKVISAYWFFILFLVAAAIAYMVFLFYGNPYDIREVEANVLAGKISDCISKGGLISEEIFSEDTRNNFMEFCNLDFSTEETYGWKSDQYYYLISFYGFDDGSLTTSVNPDFIFASERYSWVDSCNSELDKNPFCIKKEFYSQDKNGKGYFVDVFVGVRKTEKNVK